jgi:serine/threonine protein kinase
METAARDTAPVLSSTGVRATLEGAFLGTPGYMSPEQALGHSVDARADLWALGVILYEMTSGTLPFDGGTPWAIRQTILSDEPVPIRERNRRAPLALVSIVERLLDKDRESRYQSAGDVRADLARMVSKQSSKRRYLAATLGTTVVLGIAGSALRLLDSSRLPVTLPSEYTQITDFTDSATAASLSADGRKVTFIRGGDAFLSRGQIYMKALPGGPTSDPAELPSKGTRRHDRKMPVRSISTTRIERRSGDR